MCSKLACLVIIVLFAVPAFAGVTVNVKGYLAVADITAWPVIPSDATAENPSTYSQGENNYGGSPISLAQSWTATTSGNLSHIQIVISGTAPVTFTINLFDAGVWDGTANSESDWSDVTASVFKPGENVSANLFPVPLTVTWTGFADANDQAGVLDLAFDGADQVALSANHQYIFEITSEADLSNMVWSRNASANTNCKTGQSFRSRNPLNGSSERDFVLAVTVGEAAQPPQSADANAPAEK